MKYKLYTRLIGIFIFVYLLKFVNYGELVNIYRNDFKILNFFISLILIPVVVFLKSYRWLIILRLKLLKLKIIDIYMIYFSSLFYGNISPGGIGEFAKAVHLKNEKKIKSEYATASIIIDRSFDLITILIISFFSISIVLDNMFNYNIYLILILFLLFIIKSKLLRFLKSLEEILWKSKKPIFYNYLKELYVLYKKMPNIFILKCFVISFICQIISSIQMFYICKVLQLNLDILFLIGLSSLITLVSLIPITIAGVGSRDSLVIYLFSLKGLSLEYALLFSSIYLFVFYIGTSFFSLVALLIKPLRLKA